MRVFFFPEFLILQTGGGGLIGLLPILVIGGAIAWAVVAVIKHRARRETIAEGEGVDEATALMKRYREAYLVASATATIGKVIKGIGILVIAMGLIRAGQSANAINLFIAFAGALLYCAGVLVAAQGQILLASLDSAVNSSPFLTNEQRAKTMSL